MGTRWVRLFTNLWHRVGFELVRPWRSKERLHVAISPLPHGSGYVARYRPLDRGDANDLVHVLGRRYRPERRDGADHRPGPVNGAGAGTRSYTWTLEGPSYTVSFDSVAGHEHGCAECWVP